MANRFRAIFMFRNICSLRELKSNEDICMYNWGKYIFRDYNTLNYESCFTYGFLYFAIDFATQNKNFVLMKNCTEMYAVFECDFDFFLEFVQFNAVFFDFDFGIVSFHFSDQTQKRAKSATVNILTLACDTSFVFSVYETGTFKSCESGLNRSTQNLQIGPKNADKMLLLSQFN